MAREQRIDKGNIGDFPNNQVLEWRPISFSIEFVYQMRRNKARLINLPSTRQAVAIPKLLTAIYYRKHSLIPDDFIKAAVITTPVEDQAIAQEIAFNIIFPKEKKPKPENEKESKVLGMNDDSNNTDQDFMDELLDILDKNIDLGSLDTNTLIDKAMEDFTGLMDFVNELYDKAAAKEEPFKSLIDILEQRSDFSELLRQGIKNTEMLEKFCHQAILREINSLSASDVGSAVNLGWGEDIINQSSTPWINATAQFCMNSPEFETTLKEIMQSEEVGAAARTLNYLKDAGIDIEEAIQLAEQLINRVDTLMDMAEISNILGYIPEFDHNKILSNSLKIDPGTTFNISRFLDKKFSSQISEELFEMWSRDNQNPSLPELFQAQTDVSEWQQMLDNCVNNLINDMINNNGHASYDLADLARELMQLSTQTEFQSCFDGFVENAEKAGLKSLESAKDPDQFRNILKSLVSEHIPLNQARAMEIGVHLGVPEEEILEIFGGDYKLLKVMFQRNIGNFQRYENIMNNIPSLTQDQMGELMQIALSNNNYPGLGALGHYNMGQGFKSAGMEGPSGQRQLAESLAAGPGDNLLLQWFTHRRAVPNHVKDFVKKLVKDALIKIALNMISNQRGTGEKGLIPTNKLRTFIEGDDMDLIDIDASIENIILQGKYIDQITSEDLMVMETEKGRVSICFLLDISGSMGGIKLAACSISVMVLIGSLRADEVAICFFESNTHVVKKFGDEKTLEDVADELLSLEARGGTRVLAALNWGAKQLQETNTELKLCFLLTDCQFGESEREMRLALEEYLNQRVKFILGVNTRSYGKKYAENILKITQGEIIHILNIMDIPKILTETLEKIG